MPSWLNIHSWGTWIIGAAAVVTALGILWKKVFMPGARLAAVAEEMLPLLKELTREFQNTPNAFAVLDEIVEQFRTNSGSSLRDVVDRLDAAATYNRNAADALKVGVETQRQLADQDRQQLARLIILLDRLTIRVDAGAATGIRNENRAIGVAEDLAASHKRADNAESNEPGAAADAAALNPE